VAGTATGAVVDGSAGGNALGVPGTPVWTFQPESPTALVFRVDVSGFELGSTADGAVIRLPDQAASLPGLPDLPRLVRWITGVPGYRARVDCRVDDWQEVKGIRVAPAEGLVADWNSNGQPIGHRERVPAERVYASTNFWPERLVMLQEGWVGTQWLVRVECRLVQYAPARQALRYTRRLDARIRFELED
jgi:hypothetical protein